jgi:hypothetical protein
VLNSLVSNYAAMLHGFLPGPEGGQAIAEVLFGKVNPSGKMPLTYPAQPNAILGTYFHTHSEADTFHPMWRFGHGLSYTTFEYTGMSVSATRVKASRDLRVDVAVTVRNTGARSGKEAVLLFVRDVYRSVSPEVKLLKRFDKFDIAAKTSRVVKFTLLWHDFSFIGLDLARIVEAGEFIIEVGPLRASLIMVDAVDTSSSSSSDDKSESKTNAVVTSDEATPIVIGAATFAPAAAAPAVAVPKAAAAAASTLPSNLVLCLVSFAAGIILSMLLFVRLRTSKGGQQQQHHHPYTAVPDGPSH